MCRAGFGGAAGALRFCTFYVRDKCGMLVLQACPRAPANPQAEMSLVLEAKNLMLRLWTPARGNQSSDVAKGGSQAVPGHRERCCKLSPPSLPPQSLSFPSKQEASGALLAPYIDRTAPICLDVSGLVWTEGAPAPKCLLYSWQVPLPAMPPLVWHSFGDRGAHLQSVPLQREA